jgi:hypothetical protein
VVGRIACVADMIGTSSKAGLPDPRMIGEQDTQPIHRAGIDEA